MGNLYTHSMFVDSGAHGLYNLHVLKHQKRIGLHGKPLSKPEVRWSQGDFSFYDLSKGSEFRKYCDRYARFIKKMVEKDPSILLANVDAISNPDLTWEIQRFFEEEHGVQPVPIIHYGTPMEYVDRYVYKSPGKYKVLGVGGLGQGVSRHEYFGWADEFFMHICPKKNNYLPDIRTHGFAMTSWELICRYPWWSVDSATWVKLSAYGWLYVPRSSSPSKFRFDRPPMSINFSFRSPAKSNRNKHFENCSQSIREQCLRWLDYIDANIGSVDDQGEVVDFGVSSHHRARSIANLTYLKMLEQSRPKWPHPLDPKVVQQHVTKYRKGFGIE